jgi:toxin FitB
MYLLDSNIVIYSAQPQYAYLRPLINDPKNFISHITFLEVLGYHKLDTTSKEYFELLLPRLNHLPIDFVTIKEATRLRQVQKMSVRKPSKKD